MERDPAGRYVLDRIETPDGELRLIAYEDAGTVWVGLSQESGELLTAFGTHTGSHDHDVEGGPWFGPGWAIGWGTVSPRVARVEVRNDDADVFPARIVPLPPVLGTPDRAAWGLAERCQDECTLVGYDEHDEPIVPVNDYPLAPRTHLAEGDDPIGGPWRLRIAHRGYGSLLELSNAWGRGGAGYERRAGDGFAPVQYGRGEHRGRRGWAISGLVSDRAERVEVETSGDHKSAELVVVPDLEAEATKAFVVFLPFDDDPRRLVALDAGGGEIAKMDFPRH